MVISRVCESKDCCRDYRACGEERKAEPGYCVLGDPFNMSADVATPHNIMDKLYPGRFEPHKLKHYL